LWIWSWILAQVLYSKLTNSWLHEWEWYSTSPHSIDCYREKAEDRHQLVHWLKTFYCYGCLVYLV
jgi:hypothetical protein